VCILSWDSIKINIGCIFSVLVAHFLLFSFGVFFAKRESGSWAKWRLALPWCQYDLWINLHFFTICMYKHCFLPVLLVFVMKSWIEIPCSLPHNHYYSSLPSPVCLPHLLISSLSTCLPSSVLCWCLHPLLAYLHLCYIDVHCVFFIFYLY